MQQPTLTLLTYQKKNLPCLLTATALYYNSGKDPAPIPALENGSLSVQYQMLDGEDVASRDESSG